MDKKTDHGLTVDMASLVASHEQPFVIIDKDYSILAVNDAYGQRYGVDADKVIGMKCYQVSHGNNHPCSDDGEECPHQHVFDTGDSLVCAHLHCDVHHKMHEVKVTAFPLRGSDGELYLGECIEEIPSRNNVNGNSARMVGESPAFKACIKQLKLAAQSDAPVLLQGETGTGKELAAEYIHIHSSRSAMPLQIVDSTVLTDTLFESEMFGHVKGAYTGSIGDKQGLFELAEGGTIFLDEIGDLPISQQAKLLRVLETGQYRRVGGKKTRTADVRIICATNDHLWESVLAGKFREDLYYRIACLNIRLPGLRERLEDVPLVAQCLLEGINSSMRCDYRLTPGSCQRLMEYQYPGNIRELRNIVFIAATHSHDQQIDAALIDEVIANLPNCDQAQQPVADVEEAQNEGLETPQESIQASSLRDVEEQYIRDLLERYQGNRKRVASALNISERTIYRKLKNLGIN